MIKSLTSFSPFRLFATHLIWLTYPMSDQQQKAFLQKLDQYGESGSSVDFEAVCLTLRLINLAKKSAKISLASAVKVAHHLIGVIQRNDNKIRSLQAWKALVVLCDRENNSTAFDLLTQLQSSEILSLVPRAMATLATDESDLESDLESEACFNFISLFTRIDGARQILIGQNPDIIATLVGLMDTEFGRSRNMIKIALLNNLNNVLGRNVMTSHTNSDQFVAAGGLRVTVAMLTSVAQYVQETYPYRPLDDEELATLNALLGAVSNVFCVLGNGYFTREGMPAEKYLCDARTLSTLTATLHGLFNISENPVYKDNVLNFFPQYCEYIRQQVPDQLEQTLLFAGNASTLVARARGVPFIVQFLRISRDGHLMHMHEAVMGLVVYYFKLYPSVYEVITPELRITDLREFKNEPNLGVEVCGFPGCCMSSMNCGGALKKCSKCRVVGYCGREHQASHWKEHKKVCGSLRA